jgi:hypothetical protein
MSGPFPTEIQKIGSRNGHGEKSASAADQPQRRSMGEMSYAFSPPPSWHQRLDMVDMGVQLTHHPEA